MTETPESQNTPQPDRLARVLRIVVISLLALSAVAAGIYSYLYFSTPEGLRQPKQAHYHFRMQVISEGKPVNFGQDKFQTPFNKDICTADLTNQPIHFHDNLDQYVHIHWTGVTGGMLMKNFGWNFIGGTNGTLGYRFDQRPRVARVPVHSQSLPAAGSADNYYIYTGDASSYQKRDWNDFIDTELDRFFDGAAQTSLLERLIPTASAHGSEAEHAEEELAEINNLVGNVVIFAQADEPTDAQIKERFNNLISLPESTCAG